MRWTYFALTPFLFLTARPSGSGFQLVKNEGGVALYERWYNQASGVKARELKAVFSVKCSAAKTITLIQTESKGLQWNQGADRFAVRNLSQTGWINYIRYDLPWPMDDQDCLLRYARESATGKTILRFSSTTHSDFPETKDASRIPNVSGRWVISESGGTTSVEYYITTTPSSTLPAAITDPIVRNNLVNGFIAFKKLLE